MHGTVRLGQAGAVARLATKQIPSPGHGAALRAEREPPPHRTLRTPNGAPQDQGAARTGNGFRPDPPPGLRKPADTGQATATGRVCTGQAG